MSQVIGFSAETQARAYLISQGLRWIKSNYRCRLGEIDLIMRDNDYLVFVEVRSRTSSSFGGALASVNYSKQQKIIKTASYYLMKHPAYQNHPVRFDVVGFEGTPACPSWIKNAFEVNG